MNHAATFPNVANTPTGELASCFEIADTICDLRQARLHAGDKVHRLEPKQVGVLALLVQRRGSVVTRDEFLDSVWDEDASDEALNQAISRLRKLLGKSDAIVTEPRVGYRLAVPARPVSGPDGGVVAMPGQTILARLRDSLSLSHLMAFGFGFMLAAMLGLGWQVFNGTQTFEREIILTTDGENLTISPDASGEIEIETD